MNPSNRAGTAAHRMRKLLFGFCLSAAGLSAACLSAHTAKAQTPVRVGDARFAFQAGGAELSESYFQTQDGAIGDLSSIPWTVVADGKLLTPAAYEIKERTPSSGSPVSRLEIAGELPAFSWKLVYEVSGPGRVTKTFSLTAKRNFLLEKVSLWNAGKAPSAVPHTSLQDIAAFYRDGTAGLFVSLDFPYSRVTADGQTSRLSYPPFRELKKGETYTAHTLTTGSTQVTGRERFGVYEGEVAAMDAYIQERFTPRFERPMFLSASIVNRYTQPRGDHIFYTMKDHPALNYNTGLLRRELALMPRLGIEYYQVFPGVFDWAPGDPHPDTVHALMDYARSQGVRMGDYSGTSVVFCPHYNNHRNRLDKPGWFIQTGTTEEEKANGVYCFGNEAFTAFYLGTVVPNARKYRFEMHCLDFLNISPCYDESHGHPPGEESIYKQVLGLQRVLEGINAVSPQMMTWSNSGNWMELLPKIAWKNHNLYLTDPFIDLPLQGLNMTRLLDDKRREQMVMLHYSRFIPYRFMTNFQYFLSQNSVVPELRSYQFGALSTLAVTPNLGLGEVRPWIDSQSPGNQEAIIGFYKHWTEFIKKNFELWKRTYHAGADPGAGGVEIYSHAKGDHGFVFLVNTGYTDQTVSVPLNRQLGFEGQRSCELLEIYPRRYRRLTVAGPFVNLGSELPVSVPARKVIVLEVRPAPERITEATLYGLPGSIEKKPEGYVLKTQGMQGATRRAAVLFPPGSDPVISASVRTDIPKQMERQVYPTPLRLLSAQRDKDYQGVLMEIQFRREPVPTDLPYWLVRPGSLEQGLSSGYDKGFSDEDPRASGLRFPLIATASEFMQLSPAGKAPDSPGPGSLANFCGAYIENAFGEMQETWIQLATGNGKSPVPAGTLSSGETVREPREPDTLAYAAGDSWWLETEFELPFMYSFGMEPHPDEHTLLVLPFFQLSRVKEVRAWINGEPLNVQKYKYPRNRNLATLYADLVGTAARGGRNRLVLHVQ